MKRARRKRARDTAWIREAKHREFCALRAAEIAAEIAGREPPPGPMLP